MRFNVIYTGSTEIEEKIRNEDKKRNTDHKPLTNVCRVRIIKEKQENSGDREK